MHFKFVNRAALLRPLAMLVTTIGLGAAPQTGRAQSWTLGLTAYGEGENGPQAELLIERQFRPFATVGKWSFAPGLGARVTTSTGSWFGAGIVASRPYGDQRWRVDAGVMPGYYSKGSDGNDLGSDLEFRSFVALARELSDDLFLGLEVEHMSNAGLGDRNPGDNRLILRLMKVDLR